MDYCVTRLSPAKALLSSLKLPSHHAAGLQAAVNITSRKRKLDLLKLVCTNLLKSIYS